MLFLSVPGLVVWGAVLSTSSAGAEIVVEKIRTGSTPDQVGLRVGDLLVSWSREILTASTAEPAAGELESPFDLVDVWIEQVPRGEVTLRGWRGARAISIVIPAGSPSDWKDMNVAPFFRGETQALYVRGKERIAAGDLEGGFAEWLLAAAYLRVGGQERLAMWLSAEEARAWATAWRWHEADAVYDRLISPREARGGDAVASQLLREWGTLLGQRREWGKARDCYRRALAMDLGIASESLAAAWSLTGSGNIEAMSGDSRAADIYFGWALKIRERLAPESSDIAASWLYWGAAATWSQDFVRAETYYELAEVIQQKRPMGNLQFVEILLALAHARYAQYKFAAAEESWRQALAWFDQEAPGDPLIAGIVAGLGRISMLHGDSPVALRLLQRALVLCRSGCSEEAEILYDIGQIELQTGQPEAGSRALCRARDIAENWSDWFRVNQEVWTKWGFLFTQLNTKYHQECAESLNQIGQSEQAFQAVEKGRGQAFLKLLTERNILRSLPPHSYPEPLSLTEARQQLDPGSALLTYSIGPEKTLLFALAASEAGPSGWKVYSLAVGADELREKVTDFRDLVIDNRSDSEEISEQGQDLYELLVRPAEPLLASAKRVLISADGPLNLLPFSALTRDGKFLAEWKPIHLELSATTYAEIKKKRRPEADRSIGKLVAFGDPQYSRLKLQNVQVADPPTRDAVRRGLVPLPSTREEVESLATLFPVTRVYLGAEVTEKAVREAVVGASWIHFAVHGLLNEGSPLNSALVLSPPENPTTEKDNGLLQAWEVMDDLPLNAELVTLSACDTALGKEAGGEGLLGLTWAFQNAGARSVLASLWGISDRSTAGFMKGFYTALRDGKSKDEALQAAQVAQIHSAKPQPFYWAAFQLYGDWK